VKSFSYYNKCKDVKLSWTNAMAKEVFLVHKNDQRGYPPTLYFGKLYYIIF